MIAVVGGYGVGMTMRVDRAPAPGETVTGGVLSVGPGGKGSNQAIGIARLGRESALFTGIGDDAAGRDGEDLWASERVVSAAVMTAAATMTGFIIVEETSGENSISIAPGALAALTVADIEGFRDTIREADLLVVSLEVPWAVARRALQLAREGGTRTLLNPAPAIPLHSDDWALIDVITPNSTEAAILTGDGDGDGDGDGSPMALALRIAEHGCDVVLTLGSEGAIVVTGGEVTRIHPLPVSRVVDTTGAGDAFTAALAVALVENQPLAGAARFAAVAGAHAVTIPEVVPSLPRRSDIIALLDTAQLGTKEPA